MSVMRKFNKNKVIAILCADFHLSLRPPIWRSVEEDWFEAMKRPLDEIRELQEEFNCPVICAGDIFDRWNSSPELINFAMKNLPDNFYSIPGQHDLPLHNYKDINKSAYWTLVEGNRTRTLFPASGEGNLWVLKNDIILHGFPYGFPIKTLYSKSKNKTHIAVVHKYVWIKGKSYPKAPMNCKLTSRSNNLGYDIIVYGDNHQGFLFKQYDTQIFNCGTLMRRKSDEIDYRPQVGLLLNTGEIIKHSLDISKDKFLPFTNNISEEMSKLDMDAFVQELEGLDSVILDFEEAMIRFFRKNKVDKKVKDIILKAIGERIKK